MSLTLSARLPKGDKDGLSDCADRFAAHPETPCLVVGVVVPVKLTRDVGTGADAVTLAFEHIEACPFSDPHAPMLRSTLAGLQDGRTGRFPLPFGGDAA